MENKSIDPNEKTITQSGINVRTTDRRSLLDKIYNLVGKKTQQLGGFDGLIVIFIEDFEYRNLEETIIKHQRELLSLIEVYDNLHGIIITVRENIFFHRVQHNHENQENSKSREGLEMSKIDFGYQDILYNYILYKQNNKFIENVIKCYRNFNMDQMD